MKSELVRVGEGYYTQPKELSLEQQEAIDTVLRQMRKVIYRARMGFEIPLVERFG
jgi:hypothetical protein